MGCMLPPATRAGWGRWWAGWPQANIGARVPASLLVLDVDPRHGGLGRLAELERSMVRCRPRGSASRVAATAASTAGSSVPRWAAVGGAVGRWRRPQDPSWLCAPATEPASRYRSALPLGWPTLAPAMLPAGWWRLLSPHRGPRQRPGGRACWRPAVVGVSPRPSTRRPAGPRSSAPTAGPAPTPTRMPTVPAGATPAPPTPRAPPSAGLLFVYSQATPSSRPRPGRPAATAASAPTRC